MHFRTTLIASSFAVIAASLATPSTNLTQHLTKPFFPSPPRNIPSEKAEVALGDDMTLDVTYYPTVQLPYNFRYNLATVLHQLDEFYKAEDLVLTPYTWRQYNCIFRAQSSRHPPAPLTYSLLIEIVELIGHFTLDNPYTLSAIVRYGVTIESSPFAFLSLDVVRLLRPAPGRIHQR
ncbi:MAG: hypothetical protein Q9212_003840 [Teloschistes hypoglaucus]